MAELDDLLERLEQLLTEMEELDQPARERVFELLDGIDTLHRMALGRLATQLDPDELRRLIKDDAAVSWLLQAYDIRPPEPPTPTPVQLRSGRRTESHPPATRPRPRP